MSDYISRQAAIDNLLSINEVVPKNKLIDKNDAVKMLVRLPSAQPERCEDCGNFNKARLLISQPERKKGKWKKWWEVKQDEFGEIHIPHWACAECGTEYSPHLASAVHYCVNCGVQMEVEE